MAANPVADGAWEETRRGLLAFIQRRVATPQDAEDLTQDVLVRMQANLARLRESERIGAWAYGIARNAITDYYRDRAKHVDGLGAALEDMRSDSDDDPRSAANSGDAEAELAACMTPFVDQLPDAYRDALRLVELEGVTQVEAARRADISVSGMKSRVQRGRVMVRELLTECCAVQLGPGGGVADYERRDRATACAC
jgi:RNA polymerase sigma-70 factor (ECF subfamily)